MRQQDHYTHSFSAAGACSKEPTIVASAAGPNANAASTAQGMSGFPDLRAADAMGVSLARATYGLDGAGLKIGIISDSYNQLGGAQADVANGYLPATGVTPGGREGKFVLQWDQPFKSIGTDSPGAQNSLAMYLFDANGRLMASASSNKVGSDPVQELDYQNPTSGSSAFTLAIVQNGGASPPGQFKYIATGPVTINDPNAHLGSGDIYGHEMMANTNVVGATGWQDTPYNGVDPPKPRSYTGYGPGEYLFDAQGNRLAQPQILSEPDYTATDGQNTSMPGFSPFTGTSAAAPDAAAVAALTLQADPSLTAAQVKADMTRSAIYMGSAANVGAGLIQATTAVQLARATPNDPLFQYQWGLQNTGQFGGTPGMDINVLPVWPQYTGAGVCVGIVYDGVQLAHPDLAKNVADSFDAVSNLNLSNSLGAAETVRSVFV